MFRCQRGCVKRSVLTCERQSNPVLKDEVGARRLTALVAAAVDFGEDWQAETTSRRSLEKVFRCSCPKLRKFSRRASRKK